jgi:excisionase family DNA binding protein
MDKLILSSLTEAEIKKLVTEGVREALGSSEYKQNPANQSEYVEIDEACKILMKSKPTIYSLVCKKEIPHYKRGKRLYFKRSELLEWLMQGRRKTIEEIRHSSDKSLSIKGRFY